MRDKNTLQVSLMVSFTSLLILTVAVIVYYIYFNSSTVILLQSQRLLSHINQNIVQKTEHYMEPLRKLPVIGATAFDHDSKFTDLSYFMAQSIHHYPQVAHFYVADMNGNMVLVEQHLEPQDGQIVSKVRTKIYRTTQNQTQMVYTDTPDQVQLVTYNPRIRPWFIGALQADDFFITDVYIFYSSQRPGITASYPVHKDHHIKGIVAVDIDLIELSNFLGQLNVSPHGFACIIDEEDKIIAYPDPEKLIQKESTGERFRHTSIIELEKPEIIAALQTLKKTKESELQFKIEGVDYIASVSTLAQTLGKKWKVLTIAPVDDFIEDINKASLETLAMSSIFLVLALILAGILAHNIAKPIVILTKEANRIREFDLDGELKIESRIREISVLAYAMKSMKNGLKGFKKYVPSDLVFELIQQNIDPELGSEKREITLLFTDIADFTSIAESLEPDQLNAQLAEYLNVVSSAIRSHNGTIDKFIGDAVMGFWGAPKPNADHSVKACTAVLEIQQAINRLNERWEAEGKPLFITRIGLHTGITTVGNFGAPDRMNYTAMGDSVNLASRIEGLNKLYHTSILISEATYNRVKSQFSCRLVDIVAVKGKKKGVKLYELIAPKSSCDPEVLAQISELEAIFNLYLSRQFQEALDAYKAFQKKSTAFNVESYIHRCEQYIHHPPDADWTGIFIVHNK